MYNVPVVRKPITSWGIDEYVKIIVTLNDVNYDSVCALVVSSLETGEGWDMDSLVTLKLAQGENVLLCDNKACKIRGIGMTILKIFNYR